MRSLSVWAGEGRVLSWLLTEGRVLSVLLAGREEFSLG